MCTILDCLHKYVPSTSTSEQVTLDSGEKVTHIDYNLAPILLGGDQLTVARARGAKSIRRNHENTKHCLKGIIPVIEDWHARQTLTQVIFYMWTSNRAINIVQNVQLVEDLPCFLLIKVI